MKVSLNISESPNFTRPELLLHPPIPLVLLQVNPRNIKGKVWWDKQRKKAYEQNNYCCWACGVAQVDAKYHQWLEAHERYSYDSSTFIAQCIEVVALCHSCHAYIHRAQLLSLRKRSKYEAILKHGIKVLSDAGLSLPDSSEVSEDPFWYLSFKWRLLLEGQLYPKES